MGTFGAFHANKRLEEVELSFKRLLRQRMVKPSFFIMACDTSDQQRENKYKKVRHNLERFSYSGQYLPLVELELTPRECGLIDWHLFSKSVTFRCLALDLGASEQMKDKIKEALWKVQRKHTDPARRPKKIEILKGRLERLASDLATSPAQGETIDRPSRRDPFNLRSHGLFVPATRRRVKEVKVHSFDHGGGHFYRYRLATSKLVSLPINHPCLSEYLNSLFTDCPNHFFKKGPRISALKWPLRPSCTTSGHQKMSRFAEAALARAKYKTGHGNVEVYLLENDPNTIASEVPVWLEPAELKEYAELFSSSECLTGHIDILRYERDKIEIWDYKPDAGVEEHAGLQVFLYAIALSVRTNISLASFLCGYFDCDKAYSFSPRSPT